MSLTGINTYTVKKGFYKEVKEVEIYVPSSAVFIKDDKNCGDGLHEGHYHFIGIAPYKDFYALLDYMDDENKYDHIGCHYCLGKDWVLFEILNVDDNNQLNTVSVEKFNSICDFSKYCIGAFKDGEIMIMRKIKRFNSLYDIEVINSGYIDGKLKKMIGVAKTTEKDDLLRVSFFKGLFYSDYYILAITDDYEYALVGGGKPDYLWMLGRKKIMPTGVYCWFQEVALEHAYNVEKLKITK